MPCLANDRMLSLGTVMSNRAIVSLGIWILALILLGTIAADLGTAYYVALIGGFVVCAGVMLLRRKDRA